MLFISTENFIIFKHIRFTFTIKFQAKYLDRSFLRRSARYSNVVVWDGRLSFGDAGLFLNQNKYNEEYLHIIYPRFNNFYWLISTFSRYSNILVDIMGLINELKVFYPRLVISWKWYLLQKIFAFPERHIVSYVSLLKQILSHIC